MKKYKTAFFVMMFSPLVLLVLAFGFLPERIPAHYGFDGAVTRYGSRLEVFIAPVLYIGFGLFMLSMAKFARKQESGDSSDNEQVVVIAGIASMFVFNALTLSSLYAAYRQVDNLYAEVDLIRIMFTLVGLSLVIVGNVMPKLKRNSLMGLRTKWSLSSDEAWRKSQRFGGITLAVTGILLAVGNVFLYSSWSLGLSTILIIISVIVSVIYSYRAAHTL